MPKIISAGEYDAVLNAVRARRDGASIEMIQSVLGAAWPEERCNAG